MLEIEHLSNLITHINSSIKSTLISKCNINYNKRIQLCTTNIKSVTGQSH